VFTHIHLHYNLYGHVEPAKAEKAISLSIERYCTVTKMIDKMARVTHTFTIFNSTLTTDEHAPE
jgi:putative redox protein